MFLTLMGLAGSLGMVAMYAMLEAGRITSKSTWFYAVNAIGALLVTIAIAADFDRGDLGGITTEVFWFFISLKGLVKCISRKEERV